MAIQFLFGGSGSGKTEYLIRQAVVNAPKDFSRNWLFLVPEQDTLGMQQQVVNHPENRGHGMLNIDVESFQRLAYRVFEDLGMEVPRIIDDAGKVMILRRAADSVKGDLKLYGSQLGKPGFLDELKSQISELSQYRVLPDMILAAAAHTSSGYMNAKLSDLALLYEAFQKFMMERGFITEEELLDRLRQVLPESSILRNTTLLFDGFTGFTPVQLEILREMLQESPLLLFSLDVSRAERKGIGEDPAPEALFHLTAQTVSRLVKTARELSVPILPPIDLNVFDARTGKSRQEDTPLPRFTAVPALDYLEKTIYRPKQKPWKQDAVGIRITETPDIRTELSYVAAEIERGVREEGLRYRDFALIVTDAESYRDLVYEIFTQSRIPWFFDDAENLLNSEYASIYRSALEAVERSFAFDPVIRFLRSLPVSASEANEIDLFENYLRATGIQGVKRLSEPFTQYEPLRRKLLTPLLKMREAVSGNDVTISDRIRALRRLQEDLDAAGRITAEAEEIRAGGSQNLAERLERETDGVEAVLDRMEELLGDSVVSRSEFRDLFEAGLSETDLRVIPATLDEVVIGDMKRSRFAGIRRFFLLGANAALLPKAESDEKIITDRERRVFRELKIQLAPDREEDALNGRFYIYRALLNPSERLYISYPLSGRSGKGMKPAPLIRDLLTLFPGLKVHAVREVSDRLYTPAELAAGAAEMLPQYREGILPEDAVRGVRLLTASLKLLLEDPETRDQTLALLDAASTSYTDSPIGRSAARMLYGSILTGSITRFEQFQRCQYAHFLRYGLHLQERKLFEVAPFDIGNLYHQAIEHVFRKAAEDSRQISEYSEEELTELSRASVAEAARSYSGELLVSTAGSRYLVHKAERAAETTLKTLALQIKLGEFQTVSVERPFSLIRPGMNLTGRIDRVDLCSRDGKYYVRIIDYKSGRTQFDLGLVYDGLELQLPAYLNASSASVRNLHPRAEVIPAAMLYYNIKDPVVDYEPELLVESEKPEDSVEESPELTKKRFQELRMNGLVNLDPEIIRMMDANLPVNGLSDILPVTMKSGKVDASKKGAATTKQFEDLLRYVDQTMDRIASEIGEGQIRVNPVRLDQNRTACSYCPYHAVCGFDEGIRGFHYRAREKRKAQEIWDELDRDSVNPEENRKTDEVTGEQAGETRKK